MHAFRGLGRALLLVAVTTLVAACSGSSATAAPSAAPSGAGIAVTGAWVRNSTAMTGALAGYLVIASGGAADTLLSASSPIAKTVQLHETKAVQASPAASTGMGGMGSAMPSAMASSSMGAMMTMVEVDKVAIPAGGTVEFKPGGLHIMFMDLVSTPAAGTTIDLTLVFEKAGSITVKAEVRAQ